MQCGSSTIPDTEPFSRDCQMTSNNELLFSRAQRTTPGGVNSPVRAFRSVGGTPRFITRAEGPYFWDADDKRYIDYIGSWGPAIVGHAHPEVVKAASGVLTFGNPTSAGMPEDFVKNTLVLDYNDTQQLEDTFKSIGHDIACVIIEPVAANMNLVRATSEFLHTLRRLCTEYGS